MFGDFLNRGKHGQLDFENIDDLEDGTPIVARYNNREFQFGIYGEGYMSIQTGRCVFVNWRKINGWIEKRQWGN